MGEYTYEYEEHPEDATKEKHHEISLRNLNASFEMDPIRHLMAPTAEDVAERARVGRMTEEELDDAVRERADG